VSHRNSAAPLLTYELVHRFKAVIYLFDGRSDCATGLKCGAGNELLTGTVGSSRREAIPQSARPSLPEWTLHRSEFGSPVVIESGTKEGWPRSEKWPWGVSSGRSFRAFAGQDEHPEAASDYFGANCERTESYSNSRKRMEGKPYRAITGKATRPRLHLTRIPLPDPRRRSSLYDHSREFCRCNDETCCECWPPERYCNSRRGKCLP